MIDHIKPDLGKNSSKIVLFVQSYCTMFSIIHAIFFIKQFELQRLGYPYYKCHPSATAGSLNLYNQTFKDSYSRSVSVMLMIPTIIVDGHSSLKIEDRCFLMLHILL